MQIEIPDDQVPSDLADAMVRALITYSQLDSPGARLEILQVGADDYDVRLHDGDGYHERVETS